MTLSSHSKSNFSTSKLLLAKHTKKESNFCYESALLKCVSTWFSKFIYMCTSGESNRRVSLENFLNFTHNKSLNDSFFPFKQFHGVKMIRLNFRVSYLDSEDSSNFISSYFFVPTFVLLSPNWLRTFFWNNDILLARVSLSMWGNTLLAVSKWL